MQYRNDKYGNKISVLGYGCMRFSQKAGRVELEKTEKEILAAYEAGVNYYDTAYIYPGSEAALGEILEVAPVMMRRFRLGDVSTGVRFVMCIGKGLGAILAALVFTL